MHGLKTKVWCAVSGRRIIGPVILKEKFVTLCDIDYVTFFDQQTDEDN
jgi:hypothetical protein